MGKDQVIEFDGKCAFALSLGKIDVLGGKSSLTLDEKTYSFSNSVAKFLFRFLPGRDKRIQNAVNQWGKSV